MFDRMAAGRVFGLAAALCLFFTAGEARVVKSEITELDKIVRLHPEYPIPNEPHQLFYIERSSNSNTVVYCAKLGADGKLDPKEPVVAYWRWYNRGGYIKQLNFAERMMAYGIKSVKRDGPDRYTFTVAAFTDRPITIGLDAKGRPEAFMKSGGRMARIEYVYLVVDDSGILPDVPEADFFGYDRDSGKPFREHVKLR